MERSVDDAGRDRIHADIVPTEFRGQLDRQRMDRALACHAGTGTASCDAAFRTCGADVYDGSSVRLQEHLANDCLGGEPCTFEVDAQKAIQVGLVDVQKGPGPIDPCVVDQYIY